MSYIISCAIFYLSYLAFPFALIIAIFVYKIKDRIIRLIMAGLLGLSLVFVYARFIEPKILVIRHEELYFGKSMCKNVKIAVFADTHFGIYSNGVPMEKIVDKIQKEHPDIILIPGDFVTEIRADKIDETIAPMSKLNIPTFAVLGNHDLGIPGEDMSAPLRAALKKYGINEMDNCSSKTEVRGCKINLLGLAELWTGKEDLSLLDNLNKDNLNFALAHNPDMAYKFPPNKNIDLLVSGHTHNGQIHLPFIYKFAIPTEQSFEKGFQRSNGYNVFVSSGIGMTGLPLRLFNFPQVDIIEIK